MLSARSMVSTVAMLGMVLAATVAQAQGNWHEDLSPCSGSSAEPSQSGAWGVAFCNRTGHDIVVEFHDNDCPANNWTRRGDVYRKNLRRGESLTLPLCYVNQPQRTANPAPGIPTLRVPGGKGVVTTWNVVGDCGENSDRLNLDARTFYDRGDYQTGIILLQYPAGASHCVAQASSAARPQVQPSMEANRSSAAPPPVPSVEASRPVAAPPPIPVQPTESPRSSVAAAPAAASAAEPAAPILNSSEPSLYAAIDANDSLSRTVYVLSANAQGLPKYNCQVTLALTFTDGGSWNDRLKAEVANVGRDARVSTRKYGKSVSKVVLASSKCSPL